MSDVLDKTSKEISHLAKSTGETPGHIRLCPDCYKEATGWADGYPQKEREEVLRLSTGTAVMPSAFKVLCFNCGNGKKMTEEYLFWRGKKSTKELPNEWED
jgi:hypothetical protein